MISTLPIGSPFLTSLPGSTSSSDEHAGDLRLHLDLTAAARSSPVATVFLRDVRGLRGSRSSRPPAWPATSCTDRRTRRAIGMHARMINRTHQDAFHDSPLLGAERLDRLDRGGVGGGHDAGERAGNRPGRRRPGRSCRGRPRGNRTASSVMFASAASATTAARLPTAMPTRPAIVVSDDRLLQHHRDDERGVAPSALRTPISLVRSLTAISMMFDTPTTPASSVSAADDPADRPQHRRTPSRTCRTSRTC